MKEERFPQSGNPFQELEDQLGQVGSFRGSVESTEAVLRQAKQRVTRTDGSEHLATVPSLRCILLVHTEHWVLKSQASVDSPSERSRVGVWRQPEEAGVVQASTADMQRTESRFATEGPLLMQVHKGRDGAHHRRLALCLLTAGATPPL